MTRRPSSVRRIATSVVSAALVVFGSARLDGQHDVQYAVKAEFLYNFVQFITWPAAAFPAASSPFRVCIAGRDPFVATSPSPGTQGTLLDKAVRGERVDGHPVIVEHPDVTGLARCQVVFVSEADTPRTAEFLKAVPSNSVLTVGESTDFLRAGGAVAFVIDGGRVHFDVNLLATQIKDLRVSSKLLRLARVTWRSQQERQSRPQAPR
jgi:hypothetical protein